MKAYKKYLLRETDRIQKETNIPKPIILKELLKEHLLEQNEMTFDLVFEKEEMLNDNTLLNVANRLLRERTLKEPQ